MLQIKCPQCGMITNINEEKFLIFSKAVTDGSANVYNRDLHARCLSCGAEPPIQFRRFVELAIKKTDFSGWEMGSLFDRSQADK